MRHLFLILSSAAVLTSCASSDEPSEIKKEIERIENGIKADAESGFAPKADFGPSPLDG